MREEGCIMNQTNEKPELAENIKNALQKLTQDNKYMQNLQIEILEMKLGYVK